MTIRSLEKFNAALWDWGCLDGCFGQSRISPTDIDGIVEHRGRFLLLEAKGPKASVSRGQGIMFDHLMRTGIFTVFVIWGSPGAPVRGQLWPAKPRPCDLAGLRRVVSGWYLLTSSKQRGNLARCNQEVTDGSEKEAEGAPRNGTRDHR